MPPRTVLHGIDQSGESFANKPPTGNHGARWFDEELGGVFIYDANDKKWKPDGDIVARWSFTEDGGDIGWYDLGVTLPAGTLIFDGVVQVIDPLVGGGKIGLKVESAAGATNDILGDTALTIEGLTDITPDGTATNTILLTADRNIKCQITTAAFTAGALELHLRCLRGGVSEETSSSSSSSVTSSSSSSSSSSSVTSSSSSSSVTSSSSSGTSSSSATSSSSSSSATSSSSSVTSSSSSSVTSSSSSSSSATSSSSSVTSSSSSA